MPSPHHPIDVFLTVDTELWPLVEGWPRQRLPASKTDFSNEYALFIEGETAAGRHGLGYQLRTLGSAGLKATFFVETMHTVAAGPALVAQMVREIEQAGQETQLHVHTEWLSDCRDGTLHLEYGPGIAGYDPGAQLGILRDAKSRLVAAGAPAPVAFRAGSYAADPGTLPLLAQIGITFDSSFNPTMPWQSWPVNGSEMPHHPCQMSGVWEFPVSCFQDYPGHMRHTQVCAASVAEIEHVLRQAEAHRWRSVVIVLHSSEFVDKRGLYVGRAPRTSKVLLRRFERLCRFLERERDRYRTRHFRELAHMDDHGCKNPAPIRGRLIATAARQVEQLASNWW